MCVNYSRKLRAPIYRLHTNEGQQKHQKWFYLDFKSILHSCAPTLKKKIQKEKGPNIDKTKKSHLHPPFTEKENASSEDNCVTYSRQ